MIEKIMNAFNNHIVENEEVENIFVPRTNMKISKTIDANPGASFNERASGLLQLKPLSVKQIKNN
tara:strand:- start:623 stop:817 length:195 start_codon:yes stop_codon:yes gene_type:complete